MTFNEAAFATQHCAINVGADATGQTAHADRDCAVVRARERAAPRAARLKPRTPQAHAFDPCSRRGSVESLNTSHLDGSRPTQQDLPA